MARAGNASVARLRVGVVAGEDADVVVVSGEVDVAANIPLAGELQRLANDRDGGAVVDLRKVRFMDTTRSAPSAHLPAPAQAAAPEADRGVCARPRLSDPPYARASGKPQRGLPRRRRRAGGWRRARPSAKAATDAMDLS